MCLNHTGKIHLHLRSKWRLISKMGVLSNTLLLSYVTNTHAAQQSMTSLSLLKSVSPLGILKDPMCSCTIMSLYEWVSGLTFFLLALSAKSCRGWWEVFGQTSQWCFSKSQDYKGQWALSSKDHDCLCKISRQSIKKLLLLLAEWEICDITPGLSFKTAAVFHTYSIVCVCAQL